MRNPADIRLCISLSHKYCLFRRPTYQLTQVVVCVILRCIILVSECVMSGYCVISGCHVKLHHSCVSLCHVMLLYVSFQSILHFMLLCVFHVEVQCQPLSHQEFCHLNFHLPSSFDFILSLFCLFYFCFLFAHSSILFLFFICPLLEKIK